MNLEFTKPQNLGSLLMKSSQSNFDLRAPNSFLVRSQLIATVTKTKVFPYREGKCLIWDFTCGDTLCQSYVSDTALEPGKAAEARETHKLKKYEELKSNYIVTPVAIETFGPWAPMGLKLIKEVGKKIGDLTGEKRSTSYLLQSISIAIQRGNAASVMGTVYNDRKLEEIYNL